MQKINQKRNLFPVFLYICPEPVAIKDQVMANGTLIHQWQFHGYWTQEWTFERYSGFYYTIRSTVSGTPYYMSTDGSTVKLKSNANGITDDMLWYLSYSDYGNMKIAPKARHSQNYVMAVAWDGTNQEQNGLAFIEQLYSDDAYDTDEWDVYVPYTIHVNAMIDQDYAERHNNNHVVVVSGYMEFLRTRFWNEFSVLVKYSLSSFTSLADTCSSDNDSLCNCDPSQICENSVITGNGDGEYTYHHTNVFNNLAQIDVPDNVYTLVLFGHRMCKNQAPEGSVVSVHIGNDVIGSSWSDLRLAYVEYQADFSDEEHNYERNSIIHEVGHWLGAPDHYGSETYTGQPSVEDLNALYQSQGLSFDNNCIYGTKWRSNSSVDENCTYCSGCTAIMRKG